MSRISRIAEHVTMPCFYVAIVLFFIQVYGLIHHEVDLITRRLP